MVAILFSTAYRFLHFQYIKYFHAVSLTAPEYQLNLHPGGHSYIMDDMDVCQGLSNPYPLQTKILTNFGPFADKWRKIFENICPKTPENQFLAAYICIFEKKVMILKTFDTLDSLKTTPSADFRV